jgi:hypothetical protein
MNEENVETLAVHLRPAAPAMLVHRRDVIASITGEFMQCQPFGGMA